MQNILIGSGFYSNIDDRSSKLSLLFDWLKNTSKVSSRIVIVDNSDFGLWKINETIRIKRNLGHAGDALNIVSKHRLLGWSVSWMIPAVIAYSEGLDFVYKEQDCLAFGDWLPIIRRGRMTIGRNATMPCEQSLFFIRNDFILQFVTAYLNIPDSDAVMSTEHKFFEIMAAFDDIHFHDLPGGRDRPLPKDFTAPFYLQRITTEEMEVLENARLIP